VDGHCLHYAGLGARRVRGRCEQGAPPTWKRRLRHGALSPWGRG
jgi:hypothetical protein